jgi:hypothetical protein
VKAVRERHRDHADDRERDDERLRSAAEQAREIERLRLEEPAEREPVRSNERGVVPQNEYVRRSEEKHSHRGRCVRFGREI